MLGSQHAFNLGSDVSQADRPLVHRSSLWTCSKVPGPAESLTAQKQHRRPFTEPTLPLHKRNKAGRPTMLHVIDWSFLHDIIEPLV